MKTWWIGGLYGGFAAFFLTRVALAENDLVRIICAVLAVMSISATVRSEDSR